MAAQRKSVLFIFLFFITLVFITAYLLPEVEADTSAANLLQKTTAEGFVRAGSIYLTVKQGQSENWPTSGPVSIWLARLDGSRLVDGMLLEDQRGSGIFTARVPHIIKPGEESLYLLRYRLGQGEQAREGSISLAAVVGTLKLRIIGPDTLQANSQAALRLLASDRFSGRPIKDAQFQVYLKGKNKQQMLVQGQTDENGTADISFPVPETSFTDPGILVTARHNGQQTELDHAVRIERKARVLLTTDKPLYQPGQTMHLRALALRNSDRRPLANTEALLEVMDAKGNKVFKQRKKTDEYGIVAAIFQLANEVNMGAYKIKVTIDEFTAEKTVEVKHYVLPKFKVKIDVDREWYMPGQAVTGTINATYIFGKPVTGGEVSVEGLATIVGTETFATVSGKTNDEGNFEFEIKLPSTMVGRQVDQGLARAQIHATVTGPAGHKQEALRSYPVAKSPLVIRALPESGTLVPGVNNHIYVMVTTPDGKPANASVFAATARSLIRDNWWDSDNATTTDELGLAEFQIDPPNKNFNLYLWARDRNGNEVESTFKMSPDRRVGSLLLRTDKPTYKIGDVMELTALVAQAPTKSVFVDLVREQQTLLTASATIENGVATIEIPVTEAMVGGVVATAYVLLPQGNMVRDNRVIYIHPKADLSITIKPQKKIYRPGEDATIDFSVTDGRGHPVASALGLTIVDEAVFALQDMQPGLEKIFFTLERELMTPRYEFHEFTPAQIILRPTDDPVTQRGWQAMLASVEPAVTVAMDVQAAADDNPEIKAKLEKQVRRDLKRINQALRKVEGDLNKLDKKLLLDPWSTPYRIHGSWEGQVYQISSAGPDRVFYTSDDIAVMDRIVEKKMKKQMNGRFRARDGVARGMGGAGFFAGEEAGALAMDALQAPRAAANADREMDESISTVSESSEAPIRVREYFPETLYVNPALITDGRGHASISLPMADSITTWRIAAQAVSANGLLGSATGPVRVFQDFFVDIDFPVALTRNDVVKVPIALYNYLGDGQTVKLEIQEEDWFELVEGDYLRKVKLAANEVKAEYIHLKAKDVGRHHLTVIARGSQQSDAIKRAVRVEPDGKLFEQNFSDQLKADISHTVTFPANAIPGANVLLVKVYPGLMSQVVEGLDNIFRMPSGCFEQTSSTTYPNILVLDYMKATNQITPEIQMKAEGFINQGYQRLLTYEVNGGGFEWFGRAPAHVILTAYGLMEFYDMSKVYEVDPAVISRTQQWLAGQQKGDGSWEPNQHYLDRVAAAFGKSVLRNTAYVSWALARTEFDGNALKKGIANLEKNWEQAEDAYTLALIANALAIAKPDSVALDRVFAKLDELRKDEEEASFWPMDGATAINSQGKSAIVETTALVAQALITAKRQADTVNRIVTFLVRSKDTFGTYYSTQATVWAMQVFLMVARGGGSEADGEIQVMVNGNNAGGFKVTPDTSDVMRMIDAGELAQAGANEVQIAFAGRGAMMYQVVGRHYVQWGRLPREGVGADPITIEVKYDKTRLEVDDEVTCTVNVANRAPGDFGMVVVDIGVPPGFKPVGGTLEALVAQKKIARFSTTARQVILYLDKLEQGKPLTISYKLKAIFAMHAVAPQSRVYQYYNPDNQAVAEPIELRVD